jgi:hypothetical protein
MGACFGVSKRNEAKTPSALLFIKADAGAPASGSVVAALVAAVVAGACAPISVSHFGHLMVNECAGIFASSSCRRVAQEAQIEIISVNPVRCENEER